MHGVVGPTDHAIFCHGFFFRFNLFLVLFQFPILGVNKEA